MILLATNSQDITCDFVVLALEKRRTPFIRLNTETVAHGSVTFHPNQGERGWLIEYGNGKILSLLDVKAGYLRRPELPVTRHNIDDTTQRQYCNAEWGAALISALRSLGERWLNPPFAILLAENKPRQLVAAADIGFNVPEAVVTNNAQIVRDFLSKGPCIAKPLSSSLFGQGEKEQVIFTTRITSDDAIDTAAIEAAPIILQREIKKRFDLRITVVGMNVFAAEIHSQGIEETQVDWRKGTHTDLLHQVHALPDAIAEKCVKLNGLFGLRFSAIDLVLDKDGDYWFLEINPNGQWAWIETRLGLPISTTIVAELERIAC